jgi:sulfite exporter TauE/SafE
MMAVALLPVFVVGLLGSVHCAGMCGGIVGALSVAPARGMPVPVNVRPAAAARPALANVLAYNLGRIGSYMTAGALAGALGDGIGQGAGALARLPALQAGGYWMANAMLVLLGL